MSIKDQDTESALTLTISISGKEAGLTPLSLRRISMTDPLLVLPQVTRLPILIANPSGILTQELDPILRSKLPSKGRGYTAYLAASYVQWVMSGGARVVPVIIGRDREYYEKVEELYPGQGQHHENIFLRSSVASMDSSCQVVMLLLLVREVMLL